MLVRIPVRFTVFAVAMSLAASVVASASPSQAIRDMKADGRLDRAYSTADLRSAANKSRGTTIEDDLDRAYVRQLRVEVGGFSEEPASAPPAPEAAKPATKVVKGQQQAERPVQATPVRVQNENPGAGLPGFSPGLTRPASGLPLTVTVLGFLGSGLLVAGLASGVARRRLNRSH
jgi:hypothetical protein